MNNNISLNVFGLDEKNVQIVGPYYCSNTLKPIHINLLLLREDSKAHYVQIKNLSRLVSNQITHHNHQVFICNCCLLHFSTIENLNEHSLECNRIVTSLPSINNRLVKCKFVKPELEVLFAIYANLERILQDYDICLPASSAS